jgi:hypothetical protein
LPQATLPSSFKTVTAFRFGRGSWLLELAPKPVCVAYSRAAAIGRRLAGKLSRRSMRCVGNILQSFIVSCIEGAFKDSDAKASCRSRQDPQCGESSGAIRFADLAVAALINLIIRQVAPSHEFVDKGVQNNPDSTLIHDLTFDSLSSKN